MLMKKTKVTNITKLLVAIGILLIAATTHAQIVSCGPAKKEPIKFQLVKRSAYPARVSVTSVRDGLWSDAGTWGGLIPGPNDVINVNHSVIIDVDATIAGANITRKLIFIDSKNVTLQSSKNIIVTGSIVAKPFANVVNTIRFININEDKFIGGGEDPMDSDIGLWVMNGKLDLQGSQKTGWTNAMNGIAAGSSSMTLRGPPDNWSVGDELMLTPTAANDYTKFDVVSVRSVSGSNVTTSAVINSHPLINNKWTSEVCNLTRNVRIEGTATGKSHVFVRSMIPQNIQYVQFRYMGPRKDQTKDGVKEFVLGRYGIHFHHCMEGSRGSVVEGCVIRDCDSHSYVTHGSHGVYVHNNIAYNVTETAFWWDEGPQNASNDAKWVHNVAALVKFVPRSINVENSDGDQTLSSRGFMLNHGDGNVCDSNVAVGCQGDPHDGGGFKWEAVANNYLEGVWHFLANIAHNNNTGFLTWQNVQMNHGVQNCVGYNNSIGVFHGAYVNTYWYDSLELYGNPFVFHAGSSTSARLRLENSVIDVNGGDYAIILESNSEVGAAPILVRNVITKGYSKASVYDNSSETVHSIDILQSDGKFVVSSTANAGEVMRVQYPSGKAEKITRTGVSTIPAFAPTLWGNGTGLLGEYFNNPDFTSPAFSRIDSRLDFTEWANKANPLHYSIKYSTYSVRWTGKIQPQFTEAYKFSFGNGKIFINGQQVTGSIALTAGKLYDLKLEYSKSNSISGGIGFVWTSPSLELFAKGGEYVPRSQLYPPDTQQPPPVNKPPVVSAGQDITIQLPDDEVTLRGLANDPDGSIVKYQWEQVSGPNKANNIISGLPDAQYNGLIAGTYVFRLYATDDKGAVGFDDVVVTVKPVPVNQPPTLTVSASVVVTKTGVITLSAGATDPEGGALTYLWRQVPVAGTPTAVINNPTSAVTTTNTLPSGNYIFEVEVTDSAGNKVVKQVGATI